MQFHKTPLRLEKLKKPIMQLHVTPEQPRNKADTFHRPIYAAAFDALWQFKDVSVLRRVDLREGAVMQEPVTSQRLMQDVAIVIDSDGRTHQGAEISCEATWWKVCYHMVRFRCSLMAHTSVTWWMTLYYMFRHKLQLTPHNYVTCHAFSLEFFDNPAIAALVEYKW